MNMIKFIKQAKSLDVDDLQVLRDVLSTKLYAAKYGSPERVNLQAQHDAVSDFLRRKLNAKLNTVRPGSPEWSEIFHQLMDV